MIIIDGTPSKLVTDAVILSRIVDSTIIVAGHNMAKKDDFAKVVRDIKNVGGNIAGVVYNKKPVTNKKENETYYYVTQNDKKKDDVEYEQKRQIQRNRATDMLNRDRNSEEYQKQIQEEIVKEIKQETEKLPEERTTEMLKQFNEYLQKEKENRDNRSQK